MATFNVMKFIDIVTDLGEECDDEAACLHLYNLCAHNPDMFARVFFTNGNGKAMFVELLEGKPELPNFKIFDFNDATFKANKGDQKTLLLQIGPIHVSQIEIVKAYAAKPYDYILLGEIGSTLNSSKDAETAADFLLTASAWGVCIATRGGEGAPPFTVADLAPLGGPDSAIVNHCIKIAFRNTVGRASAAAGQGVAHLVAAHSMGANYQTAVSIAKHLDMEPFKETSKARDASIESVVRSYVDGLVAHGLVVAADGSTNSPRGVTISEINNGYTFILDTLNQAFGVPLDFFASQTASREWGKEWEFAADSPRFGATFSGIPETHELMQTAFNTFNAVVKANPSMPLTPAYDCVAIAAAVDYFHGTLTQRFDPVSATEIILKPIECEKGLLELFK